MMGGEIECHPRCRLELQLNEEHDSGNSGRDQHGALRSLRWHDLASNHVLCRYDSICARDPRDEKAKGISSVTHIYRDFDTIQQWAVEHSFKTGFNTTSVVTNDPLGWGNYHYVMDFGVVEDWEKQELEYKAWAAAKTQEQHLRGPVGYEDRTTSPDGTLPS